MGRIFTASLVGALVVFVWGFLAWVLLGIYSSSFQPIPNEPVIVPALKAGISESGAYYFPGMPTDKNDKAGNDAWAAKHKAGPIGMVLMTTQGSDPMHWSVLMRGYLIYFVACLLMGCIMVAARMRTFGLRLGLAIIMAGFTVMVSHANAWNWFHFPTSYTTAMAIDTMIAWTLGGFCVAAIIKPSPAA